MDVNVRNIDSIVEHPLHDIKTCSIIERIVKRNVVVLLRCQCQLSGTDISTAIETIRNISRIIEK
ncbi:MAG: hypothetical protein J6K83_00920 [Bacteroidaceae bacterium]|nr:hypothetical protein [Bacteroidaceae bacterium]